MNPTLLQNNKGALYDKTVIKGLAIEYIVDRVKRSMPEFVTAKQSLKDKILIITAETGSGKSTILPVYLMRILKSSTGKYTGRSVISCQPRVLTSIKLAEDITESGYYPDMKLGENVGYETKSFKLKVKGIKYATLGVLSAQLSSDPNIIFNKYFVIIIDEAHERTTALELALYKLKLIYHKHQDNPKLPFLIITSATIVPEVYAKYLGVPYADCIISVTGRSYPIKDIYLGEDTFDMYSNIVNLVGNINKNNDGEKGDILIFVTGIAQIKKISVDLRNIEGLFIIPLSASEVSKKSQAYLSVFKPLKELVGNPRRRVVISTAVAETGLTIKTLKYVIDLGWDKTAFKIFPENTDMLIDRPLTESKRLQRRGRVGRLFEGIFYPLYTRKTTEELQKQQWSDVYASGVSSILLNLVENDELDVGKIDLLSKVPADALWDAIDICTILGFIMGSRILPMGKLSAKFSRTSPEIVRMILESWNADVNVYDIVAIASMMDYRIKSSDAYIDSLMIFREIEKVLQYEDYDKFLSICAKYKLDESAYLGIITVYEELIDAIIKAGLDIGKSERLDECDQKERPKKIEAIMQCVSTVFIRNLFTKDQLGYVNRHGLRVILSYTAKHIYANSVMITPKNREDRTYEISLSRPTECIIPDLDLISTDCPTDLMYSEKNRLTDYTTYRLILEKDELFRE